MLSRFSRDYWLLRMKSIHARVKIRFKGISALIFFIALFGSASSQCGDGICPSEIVFTSPLIGSYYFSLGTECIEENVIWQIGDEAPVQGSSVLIYDFSQSGVYPISASFLDPDCKDVEQIVLELWLDVVVCSLEMSFVAADSGNYTFTAVGYPEIYPMYWDLGDGSNLQATWVVDHQFEPGDYSVCGSVISTSCPDTLVACIDIEVPNYYCPGEIVFEDSWESFEMCSLTIPGLAPNTVVEILIDDSSYGINFLPTFWHFDGPGTYEMCYTSDSLLNAGCPLLCSEVLIENCWWSVGEHNSPALILYPNPCQDFLIISENLSGSLHEFIVYNVDGKQMERGIAKNNGSISTINLTPGLYFVVSPLGKYRPARFFKI